MLLPNFVYFAQYDVLVIYTYDSLYGGVEPKAPEVHIHHMQCVFSSGRGDIFLEIQRGINRAALY